MLAFTLIVIVTLVTAGVAMTLQNLIHSALLLVASWAGIAAFYLWAGAEFVAFGQILVYIGAVSMVVLFAVLLTRHSRADLGVAPAAVRRALSGLLAGGATLGVLFGAIVTAPLALNDPRQPRPSLSVRELGVELMGPHAAALLIVGVILTVALIGAVVLAATTRETNPVRPDSTTLPPHSPLP